VIEFKDQQQTTLSFLTFSFDNSTKIMTLKLSDPTIAVKGTYTIDAVFSAPGPN